jgi:hypothetical protein
MPHASATISEANMATTAKEIAIESNGIEVSCTIDSLI